MKQRVNKTDVLILCMILLLGVVTVTGISSFHANKSTLFTNQSGGAVRMLGSGSSAHDSFFKAAISVGSDYTMLFLVIPMLLFALVFEIRNRSVKSKLFLASVIAAVLYYAAGLTFGVTYNSHLLIYITLFACSPFVFILSIRRMDAGNMQDFCVRLIPSKGLNLFLILSGVSLFAAWLPDTLAASLSGRPVSLIELYTTEISYVLDIGVMAPIIFICLYLLHKRDGIGMILLAMILKICEIIGVMIPVQTLFQVLAGIRVPVSVLVIKIGTFLILAAFAVYFDLRLYKNLSEE